MSQRIIIGRSAATVSQPFAVFDAGGIRQPDAEITVVTEIIGGKLSNPVLVSAHNLSESLRPAVDKWARDELGMLPGQTLFREPGDRPWAALSKEQKIDMLVELIIYAVHWLEDCEDPDKTGWIESCIDTVAHQAACCLCQWLLGGQVGVGTAETRDALHLIEFPDRIRLRDLIVAYLEELESES